MDEESDSDNNDNDILSCYQLLLSLLQLLTKTETVKKAKIDQTSLRLKELSDLVK